MAFGFWKACFRIGPIFLLAGFAHSAYALAPQVIAKRVFPSVVLITMRDKDDQPMSIGSGFAIRPDVVATNLHVIRGSGKGSVRLVGQSNAIPIEGVVAIDDAHDLVLLKVAVNAPPLSLNDRATPEVGETIYAVGNPQGLEGTFSQGIVSGVRDMPQGRWIQITAPISPGSSGGPVLDERGDVIGIAVATLQSGQNINFAIPANVLTALMNSAREPQSLAAVDAKSSRRASAKNVPIRERLPDKFDVRDSIIAHSPQWDEVRSSLNRAICTFSITNKLSVPMAGFNIVINFYSEGGAQLDSRELEIWDLVVASGSSRRQLWGCYTDPSVRRLATKVEFRVLDYSIWNQQTQCHYVRRQFSLYKTLFPTPESVCKSEKEYGAKALGIQEAQCLSCLNER